VTKLMKKPRLLIAGVAVIVLGALASGCSAAAQTAANSLPPATAQVTRTTLVETRTLPGTLGYGELSPIGVAGTGTLTWIAPVGSTVERGEPLFKVGGSSSQSRANLGFGTSGRLAEINAAVGDQVRAGQLLAQLASEAQQLKLEQARSQLASAKLKLEQLSEGTALDDIAAAQASYEAAVARYDQLQAGPTPADLRAAEAAVTSSQAAYDQAVARLQTLEAGATDADRAGAVALVEGARSSLAAAEAKLAQLRAGPTQEELVAAQSAVDQARASLRSAEARLGQASGAEQAAAQSAVDSARAALLNAEARLRTVQQGPTNADLVAAETAVETARANLAAAEAKLAAVGLATPQDINAARSGVQSAAAALESARLKLEQLQAGPTAAELQAARSSVASALSALTQKTSGPKASEVALQAAAVRQAELAVRLAEIDLANATLVAPFDGVVAAINASVGEQAPISFLELVYVRDVTVGESELPVVALYGVVPMHRTLHVGAEGPDVRQLQENLAELGYAGFAVDGRYTEATAEAVRAWQAGMGLLTTGAVEPGQVVFTPGPVRIAEHAARAGDALRGTAVLSYTGTTRLVNVELRVSDLALAAEGRKVSVTVPGMGAVEGEISRVGTAVSNGSIEVTVTISDQGALGPLTAAPVEVGFASQERADVLAVPVSALLALAEGGYGVEIVDGGTTRVVAVRTGMFAAGRVEVSGEGIAEGVTVGVPR
jgi:membrane fusion protein, multidrug efflux system